jgi:valyl-tRNA synthetase
MINILLPDGKLNEHAGKHAGLSIQEARKRVVAELEESELLDLVEDREIELAHSDRSKTPIEPYLADQWFVKMDTLAQSAIDAVEDSRVKIFPSRYAAGYVDWLSEKRDWPVGRQLWWGHQIPIWSRTFESKSDLAQGRKDIDALLKRHSNDTAASIEGDTILHVSLRVENADLQSAIESLGFVRQEDVLDTWFSSALWPHSTLGWPEQTEDLKYFYPTSTLITSRDIITLWVARMVLMGLNNCGEVPFREVFIHPKILDGYGETMSKSKGNGVDPIDVIDKFGADALRFGLCWLTTETQDVRMPVQFECPHCNALINQTKQNRQQPRLKCDKCSKEFSTQWAESSADKALPKAPVVSERFESARNFTNKLWNAARFTMMNLEGFTHGEIDRSKLALEDRWLLSRLSTTTESMTELVKKFHYAEAARAVYDFAWDDFCSNYLEIAKPRMQSAESRITVQRILAHSLDQLLRLLHPIMPFVTEAIWQQLNKVAPKRELGSSEIASEFLIKADWPSARKEDKDPQIERQFTLFTQLLGAIREIRSRQGVPPKDQVAYSVQADKSVIATLQPMFPFVESMAAAELVNSGDSIEAPAINATVTLEKMTVYVDLAKLIDVKAEIERNEKLLENLVKQIASKESKLSNDTFVQRAPAAVVDKERASLNDLITQRQIAESSLQQLRSFGN